jgi:thioredoxin reductase
MKVYDVIIVGGGPAGLNAAVVLGRCRRNVLLFDTGTQRNLSSSGLRNYLTRDDIPPRHFLKLAYKEIAKYGVISRRGEILHAEKMQTGLFLVKDEKGDAYCSRKLLIATGLRDNIPAVSGVGDFFGKSVVHCPYCDGWEVKGKLVGVYAKNKNGFELAISLKTWSNRVALYTDGRNYLTSVEKEILVKNEIPVISKPILAFEGKNHKLLNIVFRDKRKQRCDAIFFVNGYEQQCNIAKLLGCKMTKKGVVVTNRLQQSNLPGLYVAGDVSKDMHFVVVAAAEGAKAAVTINKEMQKEDFKTR